MEVNNCYQPYPQPCPTCGRCPTCGSGGYYGYPRYVWQIETIPASGTLAPPQEPLSDEDMAKYKELASRYGNQK